MSQIDLAKAVGYESKPTPVAWTKRDMLLYALGIGAKADELEYVYELDKSFKAFPTYPVVLMLKGAESDVNDFSKAVGSDRAPGLPEFDPNRAIHGGMSIETLRPLPVESGPGWTLTKKIIGVTENKSGIIVDAELVLLDPNGTAYARLVTSGFNVGAKATGDRFSKVIGKGPQGKQPPKDKKPDYVVTESTSKEQAVLYRLSGDYNPLHIDPSIGQRTGFGGVILHGLSSYGFAARAVVKSVPGELKAFGVRFTSPVRPGGECIQKTFDRSFEDVRDRSLGSSVPGTYLGSIPHKAKFCPLFRALLSLISRVYGLSPIHAFRAFIPEIRSAWVWVGCVGAWKTT